MSPPPKKPAPVPHATDPYTDWYSDADPPPAPGPLPTGERALLRFHVPAEDTAVDLGYGSPTPGIRMSTKRHAHITAREPKTTISLGTPGGDGVTAGVSGLQVFSAGEKMENIDGPVRETYGDQKIETVHGAVWETYKKTKKEIVDGDLENEYHANKKETVAERLSVSSKTRTDEIDGNWRVHVTGDKHEQVDGDAKHYKTGNNWTVTDGTTNDVYIKEKAALVGGAYLNLYAGVNVATTIGAKLDVASGGSVSITSPLKVTRDRVAMSKASLKVENMDFKKEEVRNRIEGSSISLSKAEAFIKSAATHIIK